MLILIAVNLILLTILSLRINFKIILSLFILYFIMFLVALIYDNWNYLSNIKITQDAITTNLTAFIEKNKYLILVLVGIGVFSNWLDQEFGGEKNNG